MSGVVRDFTVYSIIILLERFDRKKEIKMFLSSLRAYRGLWIYRTSLSDMLRAADMVIEGKLDVDDAIQYSAAISTGSRGIVSLDKNLDSLDIPRLEPRGGSREE